MYGLSRKPKNISSGKTLVYAEIVYEGFFVEYNMKEINLTRGYVALVDDEDFEKLNKFKWFADKCSYGSKFRASRSVYLDDKRKNTIRMHREILNYFGKMYVDHINGNTLDNRKKNLRVCTHQENRFNQINPSKNNKLKVKGVWFDKEKEKFRADIRINGNKIFLGYFDRAEDADLAYRQAEKKYFGEFARIQ